MKGKTLNYIIIILVCFIVSIGGFLIYKYFSFQKYSIILKANGAILNGNDTLTCDFSFKGCSITLPTFSRPNGEVIGYNYNANDTTAHFSIGEKITINSNQTLYAISSKKNTITIVNDYDYIEKNKLSCLIYNQNNECKIKLPRFNKIGYQNIGYSTNKETFKDGNNTLAYAEYIPGEEYILKNNITLYPKYEAYNGKREVNYIGQFYENFLEAGKDVNTSIINLYKKYLEEIHRNAPYLFVGVKINLLSENVYNNTWVSNHSVLSAGMSYASSNSFGRMPKKSTIDIKTSYDQLKNAAPSFSRKEVDDEFRYVTLVHELTHTWSTYYAIASAGIKPTEISVDNYEITKKSNFYSQYHSNLISSQKDIKDIYKKYKNAKSRPLSDYAYSGSGEFFPEAMAYYYLKYLVPTGKYASSFYPDDLKKVIEKYICIAKNNYKNNGCG